MIVWGVCAGGNGEKYAAVARPWIERAASPGDAVEIRFGHDGICAAYNSILDAAREHPDLEAVVLVHDDVELVDPDTRAKIARSASEPGIGVLGVIGGSGLRDGAWWHARHQVGRVLDTRGVHDLPVRQGVVEVVDGLCLILSATAARRLRFDVAALPGFHGYDADICLASLAAGFENRVIALDAVHRDKASLGDSAAWKAAQRRIGRKWPQFITPDPAHRRLRQHLLLSARRTRHRIRAAVNRCGAGRRSSADGRAGEHDATP